MADSEVLSTSVRGWQHTHGHPTQHMCADELADGLSLISTVVHPDVLKSTLLWAQCGNLEDKNMFSVSYFDLWALKVSL